MTKQNPKLFKMVSPYSVTFCSLCKNANPTCKIYYQLLDITFQPTLCSSIRLQLSTWNIYYQLQDITLYVPASDSNSHSIVTQQYLTSIQTSVLTPRYINTQESYIKYKQNTINPRETGIYYLTCSVLC